MAQREATCSCGQLRVTTDGEPVRVSMCHCLACQRRTGSTYGAQARFPRERVQIAGEHREYVRLADDDAEARTFSFCPECGSTVFYTIGPLAYMVAIPVGCFADPAFPAPTRSVWEARKHSWVSTPADAQHFD